jgi:hypothetical protein
MEGADGDDPDAVRARLRDGELDALVARELPECVAGVDDGDRAAVVDDLAARPGRHAAVAQTRDVHRDEHRAVRPDARMSPSVRLSASVRADCSSSPAPHSFARSVNAPMCGVRRTFGAPSSGDPTGGSSRNASAA